MNDTKQDSSSLRKAVLGGNADEVGRLIDGEADVNIKDDKGWTPLHHAAQVRRVDIALALVKAGAQLDSRTGDGRTPLQIAAERYGENSAIALFLRGVNQLRADRMLAKLG